MLQTNPLVKFDANKIEHRKQYHEFFKRNAWGASGDRFILETPFMDVPTMIQNKMVSYYMSKEFK